MTASLLLPFDLSGLVLDSVSIDDMTLHIAAHSTIGEADCPDCKETSSNVHSYYMRHPQDLSCVGFGVRWHLTVKRFRCCNAACIRKTFVEEIPEVLSKNKRRLDRLTEVLRKIGLDVGGEAAARISQYLHINVSGDTILRILRKTELEVSETPRVLGVDDWAFVRGHRYGTILVDLERHQPVDLLPDRKAETLASWLQDHPGIEIVTRDRSSEYEAGITAGAPEAVQVADRWHLLKNLGEAVQQALESHRGDLRQATKRVHEEQVAVVLEAAQETEAPAKISEPTDTPAQAYREWLFHEVKALGAQGVSARAIARELAIHRRTVARYLSADECPTLETRPQNTSQAAPYYPYLRQRLVEGCRNRKQLWREIQAQGFTGGYMSVYRAVTKMDPRGARSKTILPSRPRLSPRQAMWLLVQSPEKLDDEERQLRDALLECSEAAATIYPLAQRFVQMVSERKANALDAWLADVYACQIPKLRSFAKGLQEDEDCVRAALSYEWSNGQVEGQVNRLKFIKRQGYGRAKFDLLRLRVLYSGP